MKDKQLYASSNKHKQSEQSGQTAEHSSRRDFIKTLAVTAGGAAMLAPASHAGLAAKTPAAPQVAAAAAAKGYQQTAHIKRYYSLARQI